MIVNALSNGWEVIYHRAHALLAAQIGAQWLGENRPPRWVETIAAISHHDDLEKEWEGNHLNEAGAPQDFMQEPFCLEALAEIITDARYRGRWVSLLTSMHVCFLSEPLRDQVPNLAKFLDEQKQQQVQWQHQLEITDEDRQQAYAFMQWCDRLSLILCQRQLPTRQRALEIAKGTQGERYDVMQRDDGTVNVEPWPFSADEFVLSVEATYLSQLKFASNDDLITALQLAPIQDLTWKFVK